MQYEGQANSWVARTFPFGNVDWEDFVAQINAQYIPPDALVRLHAEWNARPYAARTDQAARPVQHSQHREGLLSAAAAIPRSWDLQRSNLRGY